MSGIMCEFMADELSASELSTAVSFSGRLGLLFTDGEVLHGYTEPSAELDKVVEIRLFFVLNAAKRRKGDATCWGDLAQRGLSSLASYGSSQFLGIHHGCF